LKKPTGSVRFGFGFLSLEPEKPNRTEKKTRKKPSQTEPKPSQTKKTEPNRAKTEKTEPNRFEPVFFSKKPNRNRSVWTGFGFSKKKKIQFGYFFFDKTRTVNTLVVLDPWCLQRDPMSTVTKTSSHVVGWSIWSLRIVVVKDKETMKI